MSKRPADSPLAQAALAFDEQLTAYNRLAELLLRTPLTSEKGLVRANQTLEEIAESERGLEASGRTLAQAIGEASGRQRTLAEQIAAHLPALQERNGLLRAIVDELTRLGGELKEINAAAAGGAAVREIEERVSALATRAEELAVRAREGGFDDSATQGHAMHQQMLAVVRKLRTVTSKQS
jgi:chromosome segregation ATPase